MEVLEGKIVDVQPGGVTIYVPYDNIERLCLRQYEEVDVGFRDGRPKSDKQRSKAWALLSDIAEYQGELKEVTEYNIRMDFINACLAGLEKQMFSISGCDMTTMREYISYIIEVIVRFNIPTKRPLAEMCEDIHRYVYACLIHKQCAVCGKRPCDLHHVDRIGMGNDRREVNHIGRECLPLCREHHIETDQIGDGAFLEKYHLETVAIDDKIAKIYKLGKKKGEIKNETL